jgi:hypothetical protein
MWVTGSAKHVDQVEGYVDTVLDKMHLTRSPGATRTVSSLDPAELEDMVAGIVQHEGKPKVGTAVTCATTDRALLWARAKLGCTTADTGTPDPSRTSITHPGRIPVRDLSPSVRNLATQRG